MITCNIPSKFYNESKNKWEIRFTTNDVKEYIYVNTGICLQDDEDVNDLGLVGGRFQLFRAAMAYEHSVAFKHHVYIDGNMQCLLQAAKHCQSEWSYAILDDSHVILSFTPTCIVFCKAQEDALMLKMCL